MFVSFRCVLLSIFLSLVWLPLRAQQQLHGFVRHNGTTHLLRQGQLRPLTQEIHLPNGRTVTPDGFVLLPDGQRRSLAEGQGCDLRGSLTGSTRLADGRWALASAQPATPVVTARYAAPAHLPPGLLKKWGKHFGKKHGRGHKH